MSVLAGIQAAFVQDLTNPQSIGPIKLKQKHRDSAHCRSRCDLPAAQLKMPRPTIATRMKQAHNSPRDSVNRGKVAPLVTIANRAGPGEVFGFRQAAMLDGHNVIGLMRFPGIVLMEQAVFAAKARPVLR